MNFNKEKSEFVTFLSFIFIIVSGIVLIVTIPDVIMGFEISDYLKEPCKRPDGSSYPGYICFLIKHMRLGNSFFAVLLMSFFISSIGLLIRKSWAKKMFVGNLIICFIFFTILSTANIDIVSILCILFAGLFSIWIIKELITFPVKNEFK